MATSGSQIIILKKSKIEFHDLVNVLMQTKFRENGDR